MDYEQIRQMPTVLTEIPGGSRGVHESCLRAYHILAKVKWLLENKTHSDVVLELIALMEKPTSPVAPSVPVAS
jgi:hypothetical protein